MVAAQQERRAAAPLLKVEGLVVELGGRRVLDDLDLCVERPGLIGLLGPNGAGKTTLLQSLAGLRRPQAGRVLLAGQPLAAAPPRWRAKRLAYLPQSREVHWPLTVQEVVMLGRLPHRAMVGAPSQRDHAAVEAALAQLDLCHLAQRPLSQLSGGEKSRALIARALAQEPALLLADEPASGLDIAHQLRLMQTLNNIAQGGRAVLISLHDLNLAAHCQRLLVLQGGKLALDDEPVKVLHSATLERIYGVTLTPLWHQGELLLAAKAPAER